MADPDRPADLWDSQAGDYDASRRRLVPAFDGLYDTAVAAVGLAPSPRRVLDLGAGTGLLAERVLRAHPDAELTLLDGSSAMLDQARGRLGETVRCVRGDMSEPLPEGEWDAVVSALAIHHLEDPAKRELFERIHAALAPGGVFVNAEVVAGPTTKLDRFYQAWHRRRAFELGASEEEWAAAEERMRLDRCAPVGPQLEWLRAAGFAEVDCVFKDHVFAVLVGVRR